MHWLQVTGDEPGLAPDPEQSSHDLSTGIFIVFLTPRIASLRESSSDENTVDAEFEEVKEEEK